MDASPPTPAHGGDKGRSSITARLTPEQRRRLFSPWSLVLLVFLIWGQSLAFDFVWDDRPFITENAAIQDRPEVIELLASAGASLRNALAIAEGNLPFFPEHEASVVLLRRLSEGRHG